MFLPLFQHKFYKLSVGDLSMKYERILWTVNSPALIFETILEAEEQAEDKGAGSRSVIPRVEFAYDASELMAKQQALPYDLLILNGSLTQQIPSFFRERVEANEREFRATRNITPATGSSFPPNYSPMIDGNRGLSEYDVLRDHPTIRDGTTKVILHSVSDALLIPTLLRGIPFYSKSTTDNLGNRLEHRLTMRDTGDLQTTFKEGEIESLQAKLKAGTLEFGGLQEFIDRYLISD